MQRNTLRCRLAEGQVAIGCLLAYDAPWLVDVLGLTGYDFVTIDLEHEPIDDESVADLARAADGVGLATIVRMPCTERVVPILSAGVHGIQVPDLRGRDHAEEIVRMTRFPPLGRRTYYTQTRAARYGVGIDERTWTQEANEELFVVATLEDVEVIERLDEILPVDGIDAYHVGPLDLAQSMGNPSPEDLEPVIDDVVRRCRAAGKFVAVGVVAPWGVDGVARRVAAGVNIVHASSAWLVTHAIAEFLAEIEERIPEGERVRSAKSVARNPYLVHRGERRHG
jgi:4-hydroxy-2-oxoheptanedioate aldolase